MVRASSTWWFLEEGDHVSKRQQERVLISPSIGSTIHVNSSVNSILPSAAYVSSPMLEKGDVNLLYSYPRDSGYVQLVGRVGFADGLADESFNSLIDLCDELSVMPYEFRGFTGPTQSDSHRWHLPLYPKTSHPRTASPVPP
jgi:hypothetical protein